MSEISNLLSTEDSFFEPTSTLTCQGCDVVFEGVEPENGLTLCKKCTKKVERGGKAAIAKKDLSWQKDVKYSLVDTKDKFEEFLFAIRNLPDDHPIGLDTETTGLFPKRDRIVGISASFKEAEAYYIPIRHDSGKNLEPSSTLRALVDVLKSKFLVFANAKYDMEMFYVETGVILIPTSDVLVLNSLDDSTVKFGRGRAGLKATSKRHLGIDMVEIEDLIGSGKNQLSFANVPPDLAFMYAAADADMTRRLHFIIMDKMRKEGNPGLDTMFKVEMQLIPILMEMELRGMAVDLPYFKKLETIAQKKLDAAKKEFYALAKVQPEEIDLASPSQMANLLYNKLKIPPALHPKTHEVTTGKEAILKLKKDYPVFGALGKIREYEKRLEDFIRSAAEKAVDGIMYYNINQIGETKTGRMSSTKVTDEVGVNIQQIPKLKDDELEINIRAAFKARDGFYLLDPDLSQIELRIFASETKSAVMLKSISDGIDLHTGTAAAVYGISPDRVSSDQRNKAKGVNFTLTYGGTHWTIMAKNNVPEVEAKALYNGFFERNPEALAWMRKTQTIAAKNGYVTTKFGRWVRIPGFKSAIPKERAAAFRKAVNSPIQSGAADIFKIAVIRCHKKVQKIREKYGQDAIYMLLFVHDEILFEVRKDIDVKYVAQEIKEAMEVPIKDYCALKTDIEYGNNWGNLQSIDLELKAPVKTVVETSTTLESPVVQVRKAERLLVSNSGTVDIKVANELKLLFNEYVGNLKLRIEIGEDKVDTPFLVSEKVIPEVKRLLPRAIVQLQDASGQYVSPAANFAGLIA